MNLVIVGFLLLSTIFVGAAIAPSLFLEEPNPSPVIFFQQEKPEVLVQTILDSNEYDSDLNTFTTWRNFQLTHNQKGDVDILFQKQQTTMMFAITGTLAGQPYLTTSRNFLWDWELQSEDLNLFDRITYRYNLIGTNRDDLNITQSWSFYENNHPKVTYTIDNNFGEITNTIFWFVYVLNINDLVEFDEIKRLVNNDSFVRINDINDREKILKLHNTIGIDWSDLNATGFETTDIVFGKGEIIGKPDLIIAAFGVTKNNGVFRLGESVELDPTVFDTTLRFAVKIGIIQSNWTNTPFLKDNKVVPKRYAQVSTTGVRVDLNTFGFIPGSPDGNVMKIPFAAKIVGIEVQVSAVSNSAPCGAPSETSDLDVFLIEEGTLKAIKSNTWSCTEGEAIKVYGGPTDLWFATWDSNSFNRRNFTIGLFTGGFTNGGQFGPAPSSGVNFAQLKIYYNENCFYSGSGDFDCNCNQVLTSEAGDIDLGGNDFNIFSVDGSNIFEIETDVNNIGKINVESTCRVDKFDGFVLS